MMSLDKQIGKLTRTLLQYRDATDLNSKSVKTIPGDAVCIPTLDRLHSFKRDD